MVDLSGSWALSDDSGTYRTTMQIPGDGISALFRAGAIPDPYWGRNEYDLRWICERDWTISRRIELDRTDLDLVVSFLDCIAEIRLNGHSVLRAESMFREHRVDVSGAARVGSNDIEIRFRAAAKAANERQAAQPYFIPFQENNCPIPNGNMLRKPQCDFGWDWNIALAPFGIYGDIRFELAVPHRISGIVLKQSHVGGRAFVTVTAQLSGKADGKICAFSLCGVTATAPVTGGMAETVLVIESPDLWWPNGLGAQTLHDLSVSLGGQTVTRRIGLRDVALITTPDAIGARFAFAVNGHEVFCRGANWIPADALGSNIDKASLRDLLQSACDAHMNMIRVWGGGRYEPDWFYDLCDELGLMVWQDFMFACHLYPSTEAFLSDVAAEVHEQVTRLNHHASIVLWCGDNELLGALNWFEISRTNRDRYLVAYDRLNRVIESALKETAPGAIWWPSSPSPGLMSFGDAWHDDRSGDMHFWSVWHEGRDFDHYRDVSPRFCSEFGFQSYPSMEAIRRFADPADFNIASPVMESHQKNAGGNARIAETMFRYFRFPVGFGNFVYLSQVQQGLAIKTAVSHWRSLKPHCMGTLYWQLNDTWPVCSWSSLDHGGNWKLLHHMAKRFFAPVMVTCDPVTGGFELRAVNDTLAPVGLDISINAARMDGSVRKLGQHSATVGPDAAVAVARVGSDALAAGEVLAFSWSGSDGSASGDVHNPRPWKLYDLLPANVTYQTKALGTDTEITLRSTALAPFVAIESDVPGRFSVNAFHLFPEAPATVIFSPRDVGATPRFIIRDLHSATYSQET